MASRLAHEFLDIMTRPKKDVDPYPHDKTIREMDPTDHTAYALLCVADAIRDAFYHLGTSDASTRMGALEMVSKELNGIVGALESIATSLDDR